MNIGDEVQHKELGIEGKVVGFQVIPGTKAVKIAVETTDGKETFAPTRLRITRPVALGEAMGQCEDSNFGDGCSSLANWINIGEEELALACDQHHFEFELRESA